MAKKAKKTVKLKSGRRIKLAKIKPMSLDEFKAAYTPAPALTLCGQLEDSILLLETRISNAIAKINSLMG